MKGKRQSTVEPVFGTLTQFMCLRKVNTIGIMQANKSMHLSVMAYNLKKYLKVIQRHGKSGAARLHAYFSGFIAIISLIINPKTPLNWAFLYHVFVKLWACATVTNVACWLFQWFFCFYYFFFFPEGD